MTKPLAAVLLAGLLAVANFSHAESVPFWVEDGKLIFRYEGKIFAVGKEANAPMLDEARISAFEDAKAELARETNQKVVTLHGFETADEYIVTNPDQTFTVYRLLVMPDPLYFDRLAREQRAKELQRRFEESDRQAQEKKAADDERTRKVKEWYEKAEERKAKWTAYNAAMLRYKECLKMLMNSTKETAKDVLREIDEKYDGCHSPKPSDYR